MASYADKGQNASPKPKKLSKAQEESMKDVFKSESKGRRKVEDSAKFLSDKKFLNDKYPGELNKFIFGSASEEYVNELFELYKKYKKTNSSSVEEFLKEF